MPELPEVTTTTRGIQKECTGFTITDVWSDLPKENPSRRDFFETIKYKPYYKKFVKEIIGQKITDCIRRGKNILIQLDKDSGDIILVHLKMTGHMMVGDYTYDKKSNSWNVSSQEKNDALRDPFNRFIHLVFTLQKGKSIKQLVLCDSRKFAKILLTNKNELTAKHFRNYGPEPVYPDISFIDFKEALDTAPANKRPIKSLLMDMRTISGIGNIYSDELLFRANTHPESRWGKIPPKTQKTIHAAMLTVLKKGIDFGGDSTSDYRDIYGNRGKFQDAHMAYRNTRKPCKKKGCTGIINRKIIGGRSAHFCSIHQILYT